MISPISTLVFVLDQKSIASLDTYFTSLQPNFSYSLILMVEDDETTQAIKSSASAVDVHYVRKNEKLRQGVIHVIKHDTAFRLENDHFVHNKAAISPITTLLISLAYTLPGQVGTFIFGNEHYAHSLEAIKSLKLTSSLTIGVECSSKGMVSVLDGGDFFDRVIGSFDVAPLIHSLMNPSKEVIKESDVKRLYKMVEASQNIHLEHYQASVSSAVIKRRLDLLQIDTFMAYVLYFDQMIKEQEMFLIDLFESYTTLFHDMPRLGEIYEALIDIVERNDKDMYRLWVAGFGGVQEPYVVALMMEQVLKVKERKADFQIYATEVNEFRISQSAFYRFSPLDLAHLEDHLVADHFSSFNGSYLINHELKDKVIFSRHDLTHDTPLVNIDLLLVQNVLPSFTPHVREELYEMFHLGINPNGYLFLGANEGIEGFENYFDPYTAGVYRNKSGDIDIDFVDQSSRLGNKEKIISTLAYQTVRTFTTSFIVSDEHHNVLYVQGDMREFFTLSQPKGERVLDIAADCIKYELELGFERIKETAINYVDRLPCQDDEGKVKIIVLSIVPMPNNNFIKHANIIMVEDAPTKEINYSRVRRAAVKFR
jgi:chemotaxis methyl-accepting protein methylase